MQNNKLFPIIIGVVVVLVAGLVFFSNSNKNSENNTEVNVKDVGTSMLVPVNNEDGSAPVNEMIVVENSYTLAQISTHSTDTDCWTTINGGVYDLGAWVKKHPGGEKAILSLCGIDGSAAFNGKHGGAELQLSILDGFKIGNLTN